MSLRLHILAIGRLKPGAEKALVENYLGHAEALGRTSGIIAVEVREFAESRLGTIGQRLAEEARNLVSALPPKAFSVVLDEGGKALSSAQFADFLKGHANGGTGDLAFLIGGPDGHAQSTRDQAHLVLSFGKMTWPHRLVRVMLAEQIYRAVTILVNHPYHRT